jgi:hypothetical protein
MKRPNPNIGKAFEDRRTKDGKPFQMSVSRGIKNPNLHRLQSRARGSLDPSHLPLAEPTG